MYGLISVDWTLHLRLGCVLKSGYSKVQQVHLSVITQIRLEGNGLRDLVRL